MNTITARKIGSSLTITIQNELNVDEGKSSLLIKGETMSLFSLNP